MTNITRRIHYITSHICLGGCGYYTVLPGICAECYDTSRARKLEETRIKILELASDKYKSIPCAIGRHWIRRGSRCRVCDIDIIEETRNRVLEMGVERKQDVPCRKRQHWIKRGVECDKCKREEEMRSMRGMEDSTKRISPDEEIACPSNRHWMRKGERCHECHHEEYIMAMQRVENTRTKILDITTRGEVTRCPE